MLDLSRLLSWGRKQTCFVDENLNPVLLVPGIGGSILNAVDDQGNRERIWVRLFAADHEFKSKLWSLFDPETGKTNSLDTSTKIEVPDDRYGLYCCDILDPDVIVKLDAVYYFHDLIEKMLGWGYKEGSSLFGFGYDFRQSNRLAEVMERLQAKLEEIYELSGRKKIKIITHSMGGVLMKSFLALYHDVFKKYVDTWIAIAAPFQGAPGFITDVLLTGCEFVKGFERELFVAKWSMHQLLIECPSIYELMANADFQWPKAPLLKIWRKTVDESGECSINLESYGIKESVPVMKDALGGNTLEYNGKVIPLPFNSAIFEWANQTREILKSAKLPGGVKFYNIYGTCYDTPFDVCYGNETSPIEHTQDILQTKAEYVCVDGDGTVPFTSAMADGLDAKARVGIVGDHRGMLCEERLFRILKHWLHVGHPDPFYNPITDYVMVPTKTEYEACESKSVTIPCIDNNKNKGEEWEEISSDFLAVGCNSCCGDEAQDEVHSKGNNTNGIEIALDQVLISASLQTSQVLMDFDRERRKPQFRMFGVPHCCGLLMSCFV